MEKIFKFNFFYFLIAFIIGMFFVYINSPKPRLIIKYPTPYNTEKNVYKGLNGDCYKFKVSEVKCSDDAILQPVI